MFSRFLWKKLYKVTRINGEKSFSETKPLSFEAILTKGNYEFLLQNTCWRWIRIEILPTKMFGLQFFNIEKHPEIELVN